MRSSLIHHLVDMILVMLISTMPAMGFFLISLFFLNVDPTGFLIRYSTLLWLITTCFLGALYLFLGLIVELVHYRIKQEKHHNKKDNRPNYVPETPCKHCFNHCVTELVIKCLRQEQCGQKEDCCCQTVSHFSQAKE